MPVLLDKMEDNRLNKSTISNTVGETNNNNNNAMSIEHSWKDIGFFLFSVGMVVGPHIGYMFQIHEMSTKRNVEGYSPIVSAILLLSNSIRILYYIGYQFALALLFQSVLAVVVHLLLLLLVVHIVQVDYHIDSDSPEANGGEMTETGVEINNNNNHNTINNHNNNNGSTPVEVTQGVDPNTVIVSEGVSHCFAFLWLDHQASKIELAILSLSPSGLVRLYFIWLFIAMMVVLVYYAIVGVPVVVGYVALGLEALLVLPQILRNHRRCSTAGLTMMLVLTWVLGDLIKVVYFIVDKQPLPFLVCGCIQIGLDVIVVAQVIYYHFHNNGRMENRERQTSAVVGIGEDLQVETSVATPTAMEGEIVRPNSVNK
ncbi:uncharacterized protein TM35_000021740 [Trypanosoma theileri]|uniref:Uncharacterized protein n=1 Tax=Trypanosoma theileri TaxID=67003 RepID=A0A1X0P7J7_9TRYP|nr:uncharacterized protein TM35_000021740 [Trypanosoma theileri]ORC92848.1 hypothetical protein TM35_000021740 [Trypanosoma theileri]